MTKVVLNIAAMLVATTAAFAGSDHYGTENANKLSAPVAANVDFNFTGSIDNPDGRTVVTSRSGGFQSEPGRGIWGR